MRVATATMCFNTPEGVEGFSSRVNYGTAPYIVIMAQEFQYPGGC